MCNRCKCIHPSIYSEVHPKPSWNQVIFQLVLNQLRIHKVQGCWAHSSATGAGRGAQPHTERETLFFIKHGLREVINLVQGHSLEASLSAFYSHARTGKRLCDWPVLCHLGTVCVAITSYAELLLLTYPKDFCKE